MNILYTFDQLSYPKIISIAIFLSVVFALPVGVYLAQQRTRINSRAAYEKPTLQQSTSQQHGPIPTQSPKIGRIFPWVGKPGDIIWIQGLHFGNNPQTKQLYIGGQLVTDSQIDLWEDTLIQAYIPEDPQQAVGVRIKVGNHPESTSLPLIIYTQQTITELVGHNPKVVNQGKTNLWHMPTQLSVSSPKQISKAIVWTGDDTIPTQKHVVAVSRSQVFFDTKGLPILSAVLYDAQDEAIPYFLDPIDWDL